MQFIPLSPLDLSIAALLVVVLAFFSAGMHLGLTRQIVVAGLRTTVQLLLIGFVLKSLFASVHIGWLMLIALVMLLAAGREVMARQKRRFAGWFGFGVGTLSMSISSFSITVLA